MFSFQEHFDINQRLSRFVVENPTCNGKNFGINLIDYADISTSCMRNKINLYDDRYIDTDQFAAYNSLLDNETKMFYRNFQNFPFTNGPPNTDILYYV